MKKLYKLIPIAAFIILMACFNNIQGNLSYDRTATKFITRQPDIRLQQYKDTVNDCITTYTHAGEPFKKVCYAINSKQDTISQIDYLYDFQGKWVYSEKSDMDYDSKGNLIKISAYYWSDKEWINVAKSIFQYDRNSNKTRMDHYVWETDTRIWIHNWETISSYNSNNQLVQEKSYGRNEQNKKLALNNKSIFAYNADGIQTLIEDLTYDRQSGKVMTHRKTFCKYDDNDGLLYIEYSNWQLGDADFTVYRNTLEYDSVKQAYYTQKWVENHR